MGFMETKVKKELPLSVKRKSGPAHSSANQIAHTIIAM